MPLRLRLPSRRPLSSPLRSSASHPHHIHQRVFNPIRPLRYQSTAPSTAQTRLSKLLDRLPRFLHPYTSGLRSAPVSHIISFLILHELTAILPLVGLAGLFHYTRWIPDLFAGDDNGQGIDGDSGEGTDRKGKGYLNEGVERFGRYFRRKGWFGFGDDISPDEMPTSMHIDSASAQGNAEGTLEKIEEKWHVGESGGKILVEVATAYAITKVLLPLRIMFSVWGTPWFARVFVGRFKGLVNKGKVRSASGSGAAGKGAMDGGVIASGSKSPKL